MEFKGEIVDKLLCMACLCVGRSLQEVTDGKQQEFYLNTLNEIPLCNMTFLCPSICWECTALLKKAVSFREQVKDSYRILQTYTNENLHECLLTEVTRPPRMKFHSISPVTIEPGNPPEAAEPLEPKPAKHEVGEDEKQSVEVQRVYVKEEVKSEWETLDYDALDDNRPLSECSDTVEGIETEIQSLVKTSVKREKKKGKKSAEDKVRRAKKIVKRLKADTKQTKRKRTKADNEQKIITIELSYEEMLAEREKEATRDSYVKAEFKCESCLLGFNYSKSYKAHISAKHSSDLGDYSCPICKTIISSVESFTAHYKRHMRRYECSICGKRTMDMKVMQQHYYSTHEISLKEYKCNLCGKISNSVDTHRYHKDTHKARVQCDECDKTFSHRAGLVNHRLAVHELNNDFPCPVCGKAFRWKNSLKRHLEKHDAKNKPAAASAAYCATCGVSFTSLCSYQRHMKNSLKHVTQDQLRFICDHCNRRFADKTKLRDHIEEKHLHKTYQCHICLKPSRNRVGLDQHLRNVHKGRPNNKMCHHCGKGFPTKVQLESHIRTHTGERPFICEYCPTTFSQQSNLYKHNRQVHLNIKSKRYPMCKKQKDKPAEIIIEIPQVESYNHTRFEPGKSRRGHQYRSKREALPPGQLVWPKDRGSNCCKLEALWRKWEDLPPGRLVCLKTAVQRMLVGTCMYNVYSLGIDRVIQDL